MKDPRRSGQLPVPTWGSIRVLLVVCVLLVEYRIVEVQGYPDASTVSYIGVALGLIANAVPERLSIAVTLIAHGSWQEYIGCTGYVEIHVSTSAEGDT